MPMRAQLPDRAGVRVVRSRPRLEDIPAGEVVLHTAAWDSGGDHPPLLLLHGLANRWQAVAPLAPRLAAHWKVIAPDLRGHGLSARTARYSVAEFAADILALISARALPPVVIYGHSLGGLIALQVAASHPSAVQAVVVGDSAVMAHDGATPRMGLPDPVRQLAQGGLTLPKGVDPAVMAAFQDGRLLCGYDGRGILPRVRCPVLLVQADPRLDGHLDDLQARRALALLAHGELVTLAGCSHNLQVARPTAVLGAVLPFLDRVRDAGTRVRRTS